jgi:FixJ family two-component response regulator
LSMDSKVKVVVVTGYARNGLAEDLKEAGATDFIEKPSDISQILEKIRKIIDKE